MNESSKPSTTLVIFGATGDLAKRKLYPSIFNLFKAGHLSKSFAVVGVARRPWSNEELRATVKESIKGEDESLLNEFCQHFYYISVDVTNKESFMELKGLIEKIENDHQIPQNRMFYMAMAPQHFGTIATNLDVTGITKTTGWKRLIIEKPFGHDLESAQQLNTELRSAFSEDEIYRIDHYLGKEMVQNIEIIRFGNAIFEPLWNNRYISNVQITSSETLGVEDRGGYYDTSGALRDMVQNHMLQMVALLAMEPPNRLTPEDIRNEKIKVLRALRPISTEEVAEHFVRGQYGPGEINNKEVTGYRSEKNVDPNSITETFVAGKLHIDSHRWAGVPFYIRTGKRMSLKVTEIVIEFKDLPMNLYYKDKDKMQPNLLIIHVQPDEGITLFLNGKKIGISDLTVPVYLNYCNNCIDTQNTPEAYERLIHDCLLGDMTNFTHWDEVETSWSFVDPISKAWESNKTDLAFYDAGKMGPKEAFELLEKDGNHWWKIANKVNFNTSC
ncbi:glucose-6-phosphate dehydrogenase [Halalkalibacter urbisdiaboli]|uniref:glucose-6-phosphate dehydrogenase n=1 Tax=Halalkalibacter urbisdiaboli TaxID=1960589 RepID=UPI000B44BD8D|nr:glucose-6-phosphate dehydrogenase [Halalkalibacter urbisdiaboli]